MNLQEFLEEEIIDFSIDFGHARNCDVQPPNDGEQICSCGYEQVESRIKDMNTRLINKVLQLVQEEVEEYNTTRGVSQSDSYQIGQNHGRQEFKRDISTIINNLKIK